MFFYQGFNLLLGSASKSIFGQYVNCGIKEKLIDFEIEKVTPKSNFWQYFRCVIKGHLNEFEIEKMRFFD
jgi:hypothetical protein